MSVEQPGEHQLNVHWRWHARDLMEACWHAPRGFPATQADYLSWSPPGAGPVAIDAGEQRYRVEFIDEAKCAAVQNLIINHGLSFQEAVMWLRLRPVRDYLVKKVESKCS